MLDFAVNVRGDAPPQWLRDELAGGLTDLGRYPGGLVERRAVEAATVTAGPAGEVLLLAGGAEGFALLPNLAPRRVALIAPSFTEPAAVFAAWGIDYRHVVLPPPFRLADGRVPDDADLVVIGNPTNPTSVLHDGRRSSPCAAEAGSWWWTRPSPTRFPASRSHWRRAARRCGGAAEPHQDLGAGRARVGYALGAPEVPG
jgi:histidinol-phosphate/aromatic aminotransferase/cobyric acid decarboxylase-like protein